MQIIKILKKSKTLIVTLILVSIIIFSDKPNKSLAVFGVGDTTFCLNCSEIWTQAIDWVVQTKNQLNTYTSRVLEYKAWVKDNVTNPYLKLLADNMIRQVENDMVSWINTGFKGKPLFIQNPELFYKNIAINEVRRVNTILRNTADYANRDIQRAILTTQTQLRNNTERIIIPTIQKEICDKLQNDINDLNSIRRRYPNDLDIQNRLNYVNYKYNEMCMGTMDSTKWEKIKDCGANFSCSGVLSILAITQNPGVNTAAGRLEAAQRIFENNTNSRTTQTKEEVANNGGFLSFKKCDTVADDEYGPQEVCYTTTPGSVAASALDQLIQTPINQAASADGTDDLIVKITQTALNRIASRGLAELSNGINRAQSDLVAEINAIERSLGLPLTSPNNISNTTNNSYSFNSHNSGNLTINSSNLANMLDILDARIKSVLESNSESLSYVRAEKDAYSAAISAYSQVVMCYQNKYTEQQTLINRNPTYYTSSYFSSYLIKIPDSIPANIYDKYTNYKFKIDQLDSIIEDNNHNILDYKNKIQQLKNSSGKPFSEIERLQAELETIEKKLLDQSYWANRNAQNTRPNQNEPALFDTLRSEVSNDGQRNTTADAALEICNRLYIDPAQAPTDSAGSVGGE